MVRLGLCMQAVKSGGHFAAAAGAHQYLKAQHLRHYLVGFAAGVGMGGF